MDIIPIYWLVQIFYHWNYTSYKSIIFGMVCKPIYYARTLDATITQLIPSISCMEISSSSDCHLYYFTIVNSFSTLSLSRDLFLTLLYSSSHHEGLFLPYIHDKINLFFFTIIKLQNFTHSHHQSIVRKLINDMVKC